MARADANAAAVAGWVARTAWVDFLAADPATRSNTSVCLKVVDPAVTALSADAQATFAKARGNERDAPFPVIRGAGLGTTMLDAQGTFVTARRIVELRRERIIRTRPWACWRRAHVNSSSKLFASFRSAVSKPSVNQP